MFACMLMPTMLLSVYIVYRMQHDTADTNKFIKTGLTVVFLAFPFVGQTMFAVRATQHEVIKLFLTQHATPCAGLWMLRLG